jgi:hypothetical protein
MNIYINKNEQNDFHSITWNYCNVDDKALLSNDPVKQQWKGSDHCYAMAQFTGVNNGVEDGFRSWCGDYITSMKPVTEQ